VRGVDNTRAAVTAVCVHILCVTVVYVRETLYNITTARIRPRSAMNNTDLSLRVCVVCVPKNIVLSIIISDLL